MVSKVGAAGSASAAGQGKKSFWRRRRFLIASLAILLAMAYLMLNAFNSFGTYYLTLDEFRAQGASVYGTEVRITGKIDGASISWDNRSRVMAFAITNADGRDRMPVVYSGVVPDTFKAGNDVVLDGKYESGTFKATKLQVKCPSKYVPL
ncbi:MAG: cytochrome c maturation protein CcmE [Chloroflexi bacterium]|nr:cytochrome c maturation protein CcmE [Chloroflexota bacterium]